MDYDNKFGFFTMTVEQKEHLIEVYETIPNKDNIVNFLDMKNLKDPKSFIKIDNAKNSYLECDHKEECMFLYEDSLLGFINEGFVITNQFFHYKEISGNNEKIPLSDIKYFTKTKMNNFWINNEIEVHFLFFDDDTDYFVEIMQNLIEYEGKC